MHKHGEDLHMDTHIFKPEHQLPTLTEDLRGPPACFSLSQDGKKIFVFFAPQTPTIISQNVFFSINKAKNNYLVIWLWTE